MKDAVEQEIKVASDKDAREAVYQFRYKIYIEEMKKNIGSTDFENRKLFDKMDDWGTIFYARKNDEITATLRINTGTAESFPEEFRRIFRMDAFQGFSPGTPIINMASRLMVCPRHRSTHVTYNIMARAYEATRAAGVQYAFCLCAPQLVHLYEQLGYRRYTANFIDQELGYRVPMVMVLEDIGYFREIRSPFYRLARRWENSPEASSYLVEQFPEIQAHVNTQTTSEDEFWRILCDKLSGGPSCKISLFENISDEDVQKFLQKSVILKCKKGDAVIRAHDVGEEMFAILSGAVEISRNAGGRKRLIATMGPGDIFGEMAMVTRDIRTADITACMDSEVLVISRQMLEKFMIRHPLILSRVLMNLCIILSKRVDNINRKWLYALCANGDETMQPENMESI